MQAKEVLERYAAGERNFTTEVEFWNVDLPGIDLSDIRLAASSFRETNLPNTNLSGASLYGTNIREGYNNFKNSNMSGIDLKYAGIHHANFSGVNLENANLSHASIIDVNFSGANFSNVNLSNTLLHCVNLPSNALAEIEKYEVKLRGSSLIFNSNKLNESDSDLFCRLAKYHSAAPFYSEEEYCTDPFIWQIKDKDSFTIDDIIKLGKYSIHTRYKITNINEVKYPETNLDEEGNQRYNALLEILRDELIDTKIYWMEEYTTADDYSPTSFDVYLIGKTKAGSFAGISSPDLLWGLDDI